MGDLGDPRYGNHRSQHANLLTDLTEDIAQLQLGLDRTLSPQKVAFTLLDWYAGHLKQEDIKLFQ